jgi:protocatechuate 3,4-dioxygenase beta subunit
MRWTVLALLVAVTGAVPATAQPACAPTRPDMLGPFYVPGAPERDRTGQGLLVTGIVRSASGCAPLAGARIEWWSVNPKGEYDDGHRATQAAGADGRYRYETDAPVPYPGRPPHVHVRVTAPGHRALVTQLYPRAGQTAMDADFVLVRE